LAINAIEPDTVAEEAKRGSDRAFGYVFAAVFALIGCWPLTRLDLPYWQMLAVAAAFAAVATLAPALLRPLNAVWHRIGLALHAIVSPLVMGLVFFLCVTPIGVVMRLFGRDILSLKRRPDLESYWVVRRPPGPDPKSMINQF
jgi:hypothetical protein